MLRFGAFFALLVRPDFVPRAAVRLRLARAGCFVFLEWPTLVDIDFCFRGSATRSSYVVWPLGHFGIVSPFFTRTFALHTWHTKVPVFQACSPARAAIGSSPLPFTMRSNHPARDARTPDAPWSAACAANQPHMPWTPGPGGVDAEHR